MSFGLLRVLNDDTVEAGMGFDAHPHENMEIISIPLSGDLEHRDSMGNVTVIREGDIQVMSAGTGIVHSEYNKSKDSPVKFLQIWIFPRERNVEPRYDQMNISELDSSNKLAQILSPDSDGEGVWINQNAWFHIGRFDAGRDMEYNLKNKENGVYALLLEGEAQFDNRTLKERDAVGIWSAEGFSIIFKKDSRILLMEVPMK
jgi:redox-sensitive bicupin YhaK (pirin superfamily)